MPFSLFLGLVLVLSITVCASKNKKKQFVFSLSSLPVPMCLMPSPSQRAYTPGKEAGELLETAQMKKRALFHHFQYSTLGVHVPNSPNTAHSQPQQFHQLGKEALGAIMALGRCQEHP